MTLTKASKYLVALYNLKKAISKDSDEDSIWLIYYDRIIEDGFTTDNLPKLFSLIHPDFYFRKNMSFKENLVHDPSFTSGILISDKCQSQLYTGNDCIFNSDPYMRGKCQADHKWPNSLGGPSILENRLILCRYHNAMKSNSIYHYNWQAIPSWVEDYLYSIYRLKK